MIERHSSFSASVTIDVPPNVGIVGTGMSSMTPRRITVTARSEESALDAENQLRAFLERVGVAEEAA